MPKVRAAFKTCLAVLIILESSIFGGMEILQLFGISINAFQTAGGLIVLGIGMKMMHGDENSSQNTEGGKAALENVEQKDFGIGGDRVQHVHWRLVHGEIEICELVHLKWKIQSPLRDTQEHIKNSLYGAWVFNTVSYFCDLILILHLVFNEHSHSWGQ